MLQVLIIKFKMTDLTLSVCVTGKNFSNWRKTSYRNPQASSTEIYRTLQHGFLLRFSWHTASRSGKAHAMSHITQRRRLRRLLVTTAWVKDESCIDVWGLMSTRVPVPHSQSTNFDVTRSFEAKSSSTLCGLSFDKRMPAKPWLENRHRCAQTSDIEEWNLVMPVKWRDATNDAHVTRIDF